MNTVQNVQLTNPDGSPVPLDPTNPRRGNVQIPIPVNNITLPGGDTSMISNLEYRIKIVGPVVLAPFADFGLDFVSLDSQLKIAPDAVTQLNQHCIWLPRNRCQLPVHRRLSHSHQREPEAGAREPTLYLGFPLACLCR